MLKYTLRIEGSAEELEQAKDIVFNLTYQHIHGQYKECITPPIATGFATEYITREPKYRCKTLGELVFEYGDRLNCDVNTVYVLGCTNYRTKLGLPEEANFMSKEWKKIFLTEVT
jgi:hypothetical protein